MLSNHHPYQQQFVEALRYCHAHHVCHRDVKLENTLLDGDVPPRIKLSDFGSSRTFVPQQNLHTKVGTHAYMSPQILAGTSMGYDGQVGDGWWVCSCVFLHAPPACVLSSPQSLHKESIISLRQCTPMLTTNTHKCSSSPHGYPGSRCVVHWHPARAASCWTIPL